MEQRTPNQKNVKVCPYVPVEIRRAAEELAKKAMRHVPSGVKATPFLSKWLVIGYKVATAKTDAELLSVLQEARGKSFKWPTMPPSAPTCGDPNCFTSKPCKCPGKPLTMPAVDGAK